ncbi:hypothetical protein [Bradyrhizobium sp. LA2.1]|uniref:hypothetical protein n=1 Tax=Bradyrhizobium sp. LA2.1 TaxID=3156376 RepID=UPI003397C2CB
MSDRDLLVVAPTAAEAESRAKWWRNGGWSVSPFAHHQITSMSERGSLFLQHLKLEGIILEDGGAFLKEVLGSFKPKSDYRREMEDSVWLLHYLNGQRTVDWTTLCGADITYVSVRNIAISLLASRRIYDFAFSSMFHRLRDFGLLSAKDVQAIAALRELKYCYRSRKLDLSGNELAFKNSLAAAMTLACSVSSNTMGLQEPPLEDGYRWLRWLEFNLVTQCDPQRLDTLSPADPLAPVWRLIKEPRHYPDRPRKYDTTWMLSARVAFQSAVRSGRLRL